ncbi:MAG: hypothetical protein EOO54_06610 [Haliea sp.]|nr:MAG: hypothetical protein EOO54_06610 [Haliea sp.]
MAPVKSSAIQPSNRAPTFVASRTALPPEGALRLRAGEAGPAAPAGENDAPTLATSCASGVSLPLAPGTGTLRLRPGKAGPAAPAGEKGDGLLMVCEANLCPGKS